MHRRRLSCRTIFHAGSGEDFDPGYEAFYGNRIHKTRVKRKAAGNSDPYLIAFHRYGARSSIIEYDMSYV